MAEAASTLIANADANNISMPGDRLIVVRDARIVASEDSSVVLVTQWFRDFCKVTGAQGCDYFVSQADMDHYISAQQTVVDDETGSVTKLAGSNLIPIGRFDTECTHT